MASLTDQQIKDSYEQVLIVDNDGGGNGTTLVTVTDGDGGTTFPLQLATNKVSITDGANDLDIASHDGSNGLKLGGTLVTASATELNYVDGVTSAIQTQLDAKQATITGSATTIDTESLTASRVVISNGSQKIAVSAVTDTELGYLDGVSSNLQTQLDAKHATINSSNRLGADLIGANGNVSNTEYGYLASVSSDIQTQLDAKQATISAGTLLDLSGSTVNVDLTEASPQTIAAGDYVLFLDGGVTGTHAKGSIHDVAYLFAGAGLTATSSVIAVDADQSGQITSVGTLTSFRSTGIDDNANALAMTIDSSERVGIGVTDPSNALEVFSTSTQQKWSYDEGSFATMTVADSSHTTLAIGESGDFTIDVAGDITLSGDGGYVSMNDGADTIFEFDTADCIFKIASDADTGDYLTISVGAAGLTTISTTDDDGAAAHISLQPDGYVGIGTSTPKTALDIVHNYHTTTFENQLSNDQGGGEVLRYSPGADDSPAGSELFFLHTDGTWNQTKADAVATGASQLLGVGLAGSARTVGVLTRGFIRINNDEILNVPDSSAVDGLPLYISTTAGHFDFTAPSGSGDFVRVVGYAIDNHAESSSGDVLVFFNPSATWVEIA